MVCYPDSDTLVESLLAIFPRRQKELVRVFQALDYKLEWSNNKNPVQLGLDGPENQVNMKK